MSANIATKSEDEVQIDIDAAARDTDHSISAEERFQLAMARQ